MPNTEIIILFARQHSGIRRRLLPILETNPQIFCLNEVFNLAHKDAGEPLLRDTNFFTFVSRYGGGGNIGRILPDNHENLFLDYLEYLKCFSPKRYLLISVTYDKAHFFTKPSADDLTSPYLLELVSSHNLRVLNLTRKNHLRQVLAGLMNSKANGGNASDDLSCRGGQIHLDAEFLLEQLKRCQVEEAIFSEYFKSYKRRMSCDYEDIFTDSAGKDLQKFLRQLAAWLGVPNQFCDDINHVPESHSPLEKIIENFDEVEAALSGTKFERFLKEACACSKTGAGKPEKSSLASSRKMHHRPVIKQPLEIYNQL